MTTGEIGDREEEQRAKVAEARARAFAGVDRWPLEEIAAVPLDGTIVYADVDYHDRLILATTAVDPDEAWAQCGKKGPGSKLPSAPETPTYPLRVTALSTDGLLNETITLATSVRFPKVQPLPDGRWLLVDARSEFRPAPEGPEKNAHVYQSDGEHLTSLCIGDGVMDVQTTPSGEIWASYFDEGVFGTSGWGESGGTEPDGSHGLVKWALSGELLWQFHPPGGFDIIVDCYALNAIDEEAWACYYTDFPVVHVKSNGTVVGWGTQVGGPTSLAVTQDKWVGLVGGYRGLFDRLTLIDVSGAGTSGDEAAPAVATYQLAMPDLTDFPSDARVRARGRFVHVITGGKWYRLDIDKLPAVASHGAGE